MGRTAALSFTFFLPFASVLPTYHRLDVSVERTWHAGGVALTLQGSLINVYDRRNLFYVDVLTLRRADQLPFIPPSDSRWPLNEGVRLIGMASQRRLK